MAGFEAKVTSKGQVTIPAEIRAALNVKEGDHVEFFVHRDGRVFVRARNRPPSAIFGRLAGIARPTSLEDYDDAIAEAVAERDARTLRRKAG